MSRPPHDIAGMEAELAHEVGCRLLNEERFHDALPYLQRAVLQKPQPWYYFHNLGNALIRLDRTAEASSAYEVAISQNPSALDSRRCLVAALLCESQYERALPIALDLAHSDSVHAVNWIHLGNCFLHLGRSEQAEAAYIRCLGLSTATPGELAQCYSHLGTLAITKGNLAEAEKRFRHALHLNRKLSTAMFGLAQVLAITGQLNLAIRYMVACIDSSKGKGELRCKAMALMAQWRQMKGGNAHARDGPET